MAEDNSGPERYISDAELLVAVCQEVTKLREELMLREERVRQLTEELTANDQYIFKLQKIDAVLRKGMERYACHVEGCPAFYLRNDPDCTCRLCNFMEKMGI